MDLGKKKAEKVDVSPEKQEETALLASDALRVVLVGHPRVGKAALLKGLLGENVQEKKFAEEAPGCLGGRFVTDSGVQLEVTDLPGILSLASRSPEAVLNRDVLLEHYPGAGRPDLVIATVSSEYFDRQLALILQLVELDLPLWVLVKQEGPMLVDQTRLAEELGVPVFVLANDSQNELSDFRSAMDPPFPEVRAKPRFQNRQLEAAWKALKGERASKLSSRQAYWLLADVAYRTKPHQDLAFDIQIKAREVVADLVARGLNPELHLDKWRRERGHQISKRVLYAKDQETALRAKIDDELTHAVRGPFYWAFLLLLVFGALFAASDWLANGVLTLVGSLSQQVGAASGFSLYLERVLPGLGVGVCFIPILVLWFLFWALLESSGAMFRLANLLQKWFSGSGLDGFSLVQSLIGFPQSAFWKKDLTAAEAKPKNRVRGLASSFLSLGLKFPALVFWIPILLSHSFSQALCLLWIFVLMLAIVRLIAALDKEDEADGRRGGRDVPRVLPPLNWPDRGVFGAVLFRNVKRMLAGFLSVVLLGSLIFGFFQGGVESESDAGPQSFSVRDESLVGAMAVTTLSPHWLSVSAASNEWGGEELTISTLRKKFARSFTQSEQIGVLIFLIFSMPLLPGLWLLKSSGDSWLSVSVQWLGFLALSVVMAFLAQSLAITFT